jgi:hypothetical protein
MIKIAKSLIHNYGVFAVDSIPKGTVITNYEGRVIKAKGNWFNPDMVDNFTIDELRWILTHMGYEVGMPFYNMPSNYITPINNASTPKYMIMGYNMEDIEEYSLMITTSNCGSLINDCVRPKSTFIDLINYTQLNSNRKDNVKHPRFDSDGFPIQDPRYNVVFKMNLYPRSSLTKKLYYNNEHCTSIIAQRDIVAGEELFMHYGDQYWISFNNIEQMELLWSKLPSSNSMSLTKWSRTTAKDCFREQYLQCLREVSTQQKSM